MAIKPIEILINAKDNASSVFSSLQAKVAAVGAAIAGYFGIKAFVGLVEGAANFEQAMSRVQAATGASAAEMAVLKQAAQDAGANTKYTSTEAAGALENLGKAGLSAKDAVATLPAVLNLAQAGDVGLAAASEYLTGALAGMGLGFSEAGRAADVLALGANASKTNVDGLALALSYAAPAAQSAGVSLEGTVAILGKMADGSIDASRGGTALANMLAQFQDPASQFKRALADAGITTNNFEQALHQLAAAGPKGEQAILAVGLNAGPALRALLNQGMGALDELKGKLEGSAGSAAAFAKVMQDNLAGSFKGLTSAWDTVKNVLGTPVLPVLKDGVDQLAGAFRNAVADGTVQKFGESIATTFQAGIKWVRDFIGTVDFAEVLARLQVFADDANKRFTEFGQYAASAGNAVQAAYGVMASGSNAVLTGIYAIGASYAEMSIRIVDFSARASDALSKIAIGQARKDLQQQAEDMRGVLGGLSAVRDEFIKKTQDSLDATAQSAQIARNGFGGMSDAMRSSAGAATDLKTAQTALNKELSSGADAAAAAGVAYQKKVQADEAAKKAADDHRTAIAQLKAEYAQLMADGNVNEAIIVFDRLTKAQRETADASNTASKSAEQYSSEIASLSAEYARLKSEGNLNEAVIVFDKLTKAQQASADASKNAGKSAEQYATEIAGLSAEYSRLMSSGQLNEAIIVFDKLTKVQREAAAAAKDNGKEATAAAKAISDAFINLGVVSSATLNTQAENAKKDYETIRDAGTSTAEDIALAFKAAADKAIAANKGIAPSWVEAQAATRGYRVETDAAGKSTLVLADAVDKAGDAHKRTAGAIGEHMTALEKLNAAREREIAAQEKANQLNERALELYRKKWNIDKDGFTLDANGQRMQQSVPNGNYVYDTAKAQGLTEAQALALMDKYFKNGQAAGMDGKNGIHGPSQDWFSVVNKAIADAVIEAARQRAAAGPEKTGAAPTGTGAGGTPAGGRESGGGSASGGLSGGRSGGAPVGAPVGGGVAFGQPIQITINANGINDPVALARKLEPELKRLALLAR